jgi:GDP-mannose 6-dehydrogenase
MVTLIGTSVGKGMRCAIYDRDVSLPRLFGANKEYINREIPHISQLMRNEIAEGLKDSEVLIVGNKAEEFRQIESQLRDDQIVIDLVRLFKGRVTGGSYHGICW